MGVCCKTGQREDLQAAKVVPLNAQTKFENFSLTYLLTGQCNFKNNFEKDIFMAINVLRYQSDLFIAVVKEVKTTNPLCYNAKHTDSLIKMLEQNEQLPEIRWDIPAVDAVTKVNETSIQQNPAPFAGSSEKLNQLVGVKIPSEDFSLPGLMTFSGVQLVAIQMVLDFDKKASTPLLKPDVTRCGVSVMDCPATGNLIQVLYVMLPMQPPTQESINQWR